MISKYKIFPFKVLYIFFVFLSLNIFFFSTTKAEVKAFDINNIEISEPFKINFNKNKVIEEGFREAFFELISLITNTSDQKKIKKTKLNEIKGMVETFSIKEEKFINEVYFVNLGVTFNKKKVFRFMEEKNIFPSIPIKKKLLFIPIMINESKKDLSLFNNNKFFDQWNDISKKHHLIEYIMPTEDLEDLNLIKKNYELIEKYDFKEIINKYNLKDSIVALFFNNEKEIRVLNRIDISDKIILKNQTFSNKDIDDVKKIEKIINELKITYEDYWKKYNQINTSIRLTLNIKIDSLKNVKISKFEKVLSKKDLVYDFFITKFSNEFIYYQIIFNGTPNKFLKSMKNHGYIFDTTNKIWLLE